MDDLHVVFWRFVPELHRTLLQEPHFLSIAAISGLDLDSAIEGFKDLFVAPQVQPAQSDFHHDVPVVQTQLQRFIHGLVSCVEGRIVLFEQDKGKVGPRLRIRWIHVVHEREHPLGLIVLPKVIASHTEVEVRKGGLVVFGAH